MRSGCSKLSGDLDERVRRRALELAFEEDGARLRPEFWLAAIDPKIYPQSHLLGIAVLRFMEFRRARHLGPWEGLGRELYDDLVRNLPPIHL